MIFYYFTWGVVKIDGTILNTEGISLYIKEGTIFVPLKAISEALDYEVSWDGVNRVVTMKKDRATISLPVGKNVATVNGVERKVSKSAEIKNSNTYVPVRFISELIDYEVHFKKEGNKSIIEITSSIVEKPVS